MESRIVFPPFKVVDSTVFAQNVGTFLVKVVSRRGYVALCVVISISKQKLNLHFFQIEFVNRAKQLNYSVKD